MAMLVLPSQLREFVGGSGTVALPGGATVGAALEELRGAHPDLYHRICTERREVRPHVNVFVGREDIRWTGGLETPLDETSQVMILPSVSGG